MNSRVDPWKDNLVAMEKTILERLRAKLTDGRRGSKAIGLVEAKLAENAHLRRADDRGPAPELSILILNRDKPKLLAACIDSIERLCDVPYEILVGDTGSELDEMIRYYDNLPHQVLYAGFYNFSICNNMLTRRAKGEYVLLLNNDTELVRVDFRRVLDCLRAHPDIGAIGGNLLYPDGTIQHTGIRIRPEAPLRGIPEHFDRHKPFTGYEPAKELRTCASVTGACLLTRTRLYLDDLGGLDPAYEEEAQDVDFCLRLRARGLRSVVHPDLVAIHYENATRTVPESDRDREIFTSRYRDLFERELYQWQAEQGL